MKKLIAPFAILLASAAYAHNHEDTLPHLECSANAKSLKMYRALDISAYFQSATELLDAKLWAYRGFGESDDVKLASVTSRQEDDVSTQPVFFIDDAGSWEGFYMEVPADFQKQVDAVRAMQKTPAHRTNRFEYKTKAYYMDFHDDLKTVIDMSCSVYVPHVK